MRDYDEVLSARPTVATSPTPAEALQRFVSLLTAEQRATVRELVATCPETDVDQLRASARSLIERLDVADLRALLLVLQELPHARLVATCEEVTDRGVECGRRVELPPTTQREEGLGKLLAAWDVWRRLAGAPPRVPRGTMAPLLGGRTSAAKES